MKKTRTLITSILFAAALLLTPDSLKAQTYNHALGIRAGYSSGISYKGFFLHSINAVEADFYYNNHGLNMAAYYTWNFELSRTSRFLLFVGPGAFGGKWEKEPSLGVGAVAGIEYVVRRVPLNFGFDYRPMYNIYKTTGSDFLDFGFTIRYRFSL